MVKLKGGELRQIETWFSYEPGYILNYSNPRFAEFFDEELGVDIYSDEFGGNGNSKAKRLKAYLEIASPAEAADVLRLLWIERKKDRRVEYDRQLKLAGLEQIDIELPDLLHSDDFEADSEFDAFAKSIERRHETAVIDKVAITARNFNFDTVLREIGRATKFVDDDPEDAITAACSLVECVCRSILVELGLSFPKELSVSPLYKAVRDPLGLSPKKDGINSLIENDVRSILSGIGNAIGGIGALRSHAGDAHGREKGFPRIDARIARLSVNSSSAISLFLIETWSKRYPERLLPNSDMKQQ